MQHARPPTSRLIATLAIVAMLAMTPPALANSADPCGTDEAMANFSTPTLFLMIVDLSPLHLDLFAANSPPLHAWQNDFAYQTYAPTMTRHNFAPQIAAWRWDASATMSEVVVWKLINETSDRTDEATDTQDTAATEIFFGMNDSVHFELFLWQPLTISHTDPTAALQTSDAMHSATATEVWFEMTGTTDVLRLPVISSMTEAMEAATGDHDHSVG